MNSNKENTTNTIAAIQRKPAWLRVKGILDHVVVDFQQKLDRNRLKTVCKSAACPNRGECWAHKSVTFILLGNQCTRTCPFCNIESADPEPLDAGEPERIARFIKDNNLTHVVLTSVTRDDLPDGGAGHFIQTIRAIRSCKPIPVELLIPDFGNFSYLKNVALEKPDILGHNIETVKRLYPAVRPRFSYNRCLDILVFIKNCDPHLILKSAILLGLGETEQDVYETLSDLRNAGCDTVYIGQYLAPSRRHYPVHKYYTPEEFDCFKQKAYSIGFRRVESAPLVRSSYRSWTENDKRYNKAESNGNI